MATVVPDLTNDGGPPIKKVPSNDSGIENMKSGVQSSRKRNRSERQNKYNGNPNNSNDSGHSGHDLSNRETADASWNNNEGQQQRWTVSHFTQKLRQLSAESTLELGPIEMNESKFSGRSRIYVGNLISKTTEADLRDLFKPFGEIDDIYCNFDKNFTFLRVDYYDNAVKAKRALDGTMYNGRTIRVSFAPNPTVVRVSNLNFSVTNELLYKSFEIFGPIQRAIVKVDDRGKHLGEGFVDFVLKSSAKMCLRMCQEKCFFLTASLRPCLVEPMNLIDEIEGCSEMSLNKKLPDFIAERSVGPRFADIDSFEHEYGSRWKALDNHYKMKQEELKRELRKEEIKLDAQIEFIRHERETEVLREELRQRELMQERRKQYWEMYEKRAKEEENIRDHRHEVPIRMGRQENGILHYHQDDLDHGNNRDDDYPGTHFRGSNKDDAFYRNKMQERMVFQGNAMQRYQQNDFENVNEFYHSTPFEVFKRNRNKDLDVGKNRELNKTDDVFTQDEHIENGSRNF